MIIKFRDKNPSIADTVFVTKSCEVIGDVDIGDNSSIWFNAVLRADMGKIVIGKGTSIQDNVVIHTDPGNDVVIGDNVTIGHGAVLHGCKIDSNVIVGMNATLLDSAEIGEYSIVGANALIPPKKKFSSRSIITGVPGTVRRKSSDDDMERINENASAYVEIAREYKKMLNK
ncbi:conserved hypothetical protein [Methanosalsum zhilinae DSM 4017]|uniref:Gamma carbonic anhydrase family protein n=1 Tax=Methanosalsum zhilinae (strain DSM 4017 / NBRC 107636 / OCM 62 / WeN5) TaxID=679901 RepID=F7XLB3_METZD|nr:gamma carbonic anhydrase family protein [Methanosalsum zhilinae]AEH60770.1 conserved hypothetical protein [Methanosalsum zhilinae DSM 4017]